MYGGENIAVRRRAARAGHDRRGPGSDRRRARRRQRRGRLLPLRGRHQLLRRDAAQRPGRPPSPSPVPIAGGRFGASLAGTPTGNPPSSAAGICWSARRRRRGRRDRQLAGAAYLFGGAPAGCSRFTSRCSARPRDSSGPSSRAAHVNGDTAGDLVTVAPNAAAGGTNAGVTYVRVRPRPSRNARPTRAYGLLGAVPNRRRQAAADESRSRVTVRERRQRLLARAARQVDVDGRRSRASARPGRRRRRR